MLGHGLNLARGGDHTDPKKALRLFQQKVKQVRDEERLSVRASRRVKMNIEMPRASGLWRAPPRRPRAAPATRHLV